MRQHLGIGSQSLNSSDSNQSNEGHTGDDGSKPSTFKKKRELKTVNVIPQEETKLDLDK